MQHHETSPTKGVTPAIANLPPAVRQALRLAEGANGRHAKRGLLRKSEKVIKAALSHSLAAGLALRLIRLQKSYLSDYDTFDRYCGTEWGMSRACAAQLIRSARALDILNRSGRFTILPTNESQTRPLARLEPEVQVDVWQRVVRSTEPTNITGAVVAGHVARYFRERVAQTPDEPDEDEDQMRESQWHGEPTLSQENGPSVNVCTTHDSTERG